MANIVVFASGNGSNFEVIANEFQNDKKNIIKLLICNRQNAFVLERAKKFNIKTELVNYVKEGHKRVEKKLLEIMKANDIKLIVLAGFMKILSADFIEKVNVPIINIHPALLPKHKGAHAIKDAYDSNDSEIGITIHYVNEHVDGGEIILQKSIPLDRTLGITGVENEVHKLEYKYYPEVILSLCKKINGED
jgi:phosphoribosylglycinamide formyltransferase 1